jgi:hypothetical protein
MRLGRAVLVLTLVSCAAPPHPWREPTDTQWTSLRRALAEARAARPQQAWAVGVRATMREPSSGRVLEARGGMAVAPGRAVRVILVAGPGATALDVWATSDRWRVDAPPAGVLRRGGAEDPPDLPIGFLRWWFIGGLRGTLFAGTVDDGRELWLLRDGDAVLEVSQSRADRGARWQVVRRTHGRAERIDEQRAGAAPQPGDRIVYSDDGGLEVDIEIESVSVEAPSREAFLDPDREAVAHE